MRAALGMLAVGLVSWRFLPELPSPWVMLGLATLALLALYWRGLRLPALGVLGFCWACLCAHWALADWLAPARSGDTFWLEGQVIGLPERQDDVVRFELAQVQSRHTGLPSRLRLAWYHGPPVMAGERWRLAARLKRPHGLVNPASFDYEAWLLARHIGATGTVKAGERIAAAGALDGWRDRLCQRVRQVEAFGREGTLAALVVGDSSGLSRTDWQVLQDTGTVHLMVISGQHVSMLAGLLFAWVLLLVRCGWWPHALPWLGSACLLALLGTWLYGWLAGFEVPVQRACVMVSLVLCWRWRFVRLGIGLPLLSALVLVLLVDPLVSLQPGFWLSFGAVALLALLLAGRLGAWSFGQGLWRVQWGMAVGLLPLLLALGLPVSVSGPLANLIAVPWVSVLIVPLALLGTLLLPLLGEWLLKLAGLFTAWLFEVLQCLSGWQAAWLPSGLGAVEWCLVGLGCVLLLLPAGVPVRALGLVLCLPLVFPERHLPAEGRAQVWVLDVGQGLSVLVRTREHALLYDAGPRQGEFDIGERVVVPSLRALGVARLDYLLLSHADSDHAGGAEAVKRGLVVEQVISGEPGRLPRPLAAQDCVSGMRWEWDQVRFQLWRHPSPRNSNQMSCVLLVEALGERLLLTGDIDQAVERRLVADLPERVHWLLLAHHGSRSASSAAFLNAVGAPQALLSRGWLNAFNHPHPDVLRRLEQANMAVQDTAQQGALQIELGAFGTAQGWREQGRFWNQN